MPYHALLLEDDEASLEALDRLVQRQGFTTSAAQTLERARAEIQERPPEVAILDLDLPDGNGMDLFDELRAVSDTEVVVVTGHGSIDSAVGALQAGVHDYLTKPLDPKRFERVLAGIKRTLGLREEVAELRSDLRRLGRFDRLVGSSKPMQELYDLVSRVAPTRSTVFLTGETGTGKDMVAQAVHRLSRRSKQPFVAVNCGAIQPTLIESELFGHEAGSFTGANKQRKGVFERAEGGTLFLDEIAEMPSDLQVKLLRVLETHTITRVGGERSLPVSVRLVAATNRPPAEAVEEGALREDLLYRLNVFPIEVPPLRERGRDVELLANAFLDELNEGAEASKTFAPSALAELRTHDWPGNVRELRNVVERAYIMASETIEPRHLRHDPGPRDATATAVDGAVTVPVPSSIADAERALVLATLEHFDGDKKRASRALGISLKTLYNRLNAYGMGSKSKAGSRKGS